MINGRKLHKYKSVKYIPVQRMIYSQPTPDRVVSGNTEPLHPDFRL